MTVRTDFRSSDLCIGGGIRTEGQVIPRCVMTTDDEGKAVIPVLNLLDRAFELPEGGTVTRGEKCVEGIATREVNEELVLADEIDTDLTGADNHSLQNLINEYNDLVSRTFKQVGCTDKAQMQIELSDDSPVYYRPYRLSFHVREQVKDVIEDLKEADIIEDSDSPFASPILLVRKAKCGCASITGR